MGHFSDDVNNDEFMNASAEEWSKPTPPAQRPPAAPEPTDRWGSPITEKTPATDPGRRAPAPAQPTGVPGDVKRSGSKWWIILIIVLVVLCLCACLVIFGLPALGLSLLPANWFEFMP